MQRTTSMCVALWALFAISLLSGCNLIGPVDALLTPPRMTENQTALYDALTDGVGTTDIQLKYPLRGENLSSFIFFDQLSGGSGEDTALVFYSAQGTGITQDSDSLMVAVMVHGTEQGWAVVDRFAAPDKEMRNVDFVKLIPMVDPEYNNIVVGWSSQRGDRKKVVIYQYRSRKLTDLFDYEYSECIEADTDSDGVYELFLITADSNVVLVCKQTEFIQLSAITSIQPLDGYRQMRYGMLTESMGAVFIDGYVSTGDGRFMDTRIVTVNTEQFDSDTLLEVIPEEWGFYGSFMRPDDSAVCLDIDNNGIMDIPIAMPLPGYSGREAEGAVYLTEYVSVVSGGGLQVRFSAVINAASGYMFELPTHWKGIGSTPNITVHSDPIFDEWSFYVYQGSLESSVADVPLLRIRVVSDRSSSGDMGEQGYYQIGERGLFRYYIQVPDALPGSAASSLRIALSEIEELSLFRLL